MPNDYVDFDDWVEDRLRKTQAGKLLELSEEETAALLDRCRGVPGLKRVEDRLREMISRAKEEDQFKVIEGLRLFKVFVDGELQGVYANDVPPVKHKEYERWLWFRKGNGKNELLVTADHFDETDIKEVKELVAEGSLLPPSRTGPPGDKERFFVCERKRQQKKEKETMNLNLTLNEDATRRMEKLKEMSGDESESDNPASCRVEFFKESGKWYTTEEIEFNSEEYEMLLPEEALQSALRRQLGDRLRGMTAVCFDPYHKNAYPVMVKEW